VRWIRDNSLLGPREGHAGMGLRFINLPDEAAQAIRAFLDERDSIYHDDE
jgi:biotin carboxylase